MARNCLLRSLDLLWKDHHYDLSGTASEPAIITRLALALALLEDRAAKFVPCAICLANSTQQLAATRERRSRDYDSWPNFDRTLLNKLLRCAFRVLRKSTDANIRTAAQLIREAAFMLRRQPAPNASPSFNCLREYSACARPSA